MLNDLFFHESGCNPTAINIGPCESSDSFCHLRNILQIKSGDKAGKWDSSEGLLFTIQVQEPALQKKISEAIQALGREEYLLSLVI